MSASTTQHVHAAPHSPSLSGTVPSFDAAGVPMRHPRPLTAAELHLELEKEQEAVVNRLTRELSALRAHSASVASTTSSVTSGMHVDQDMMGPTHPTSARRHRSSSSVSRTSTSAPYGTSASLHRSSCTRPTHALTFPQAFPPQQPPPFPTTATPSPLKPRPPISPPHSRPAARAWSAPRATRKSHTTSRSSTRRSARTRCSRGGSGSWSER